nr:helitron helicase-like domain-containing protein [Tanacetum cinerariifolium]
MDISAGPLDTRMHTVTIVLHKVCFKRRVFYKLFKSTVLEGFEPSLGCSSQNTQRVACVNTFGAEQTSDSNVFQKYTELCARNVTRRFSVDCPATVCVNSIGITQHVYNEAVTQRVFISYASPLVSNQRKRTRSDSQVRPLLYEAKGSKRIHHSIAASTRTYADRTAQRPETAARVNTKGCSSGRTQGSSPSYDNLGDCVQQCHHCRVVFWYGVSMDRVIMSAMGEALRFLQLYIYDTDNEIEKRMRHFGGIDNISLDPEIVQGLIHFLDVHNELVQLFRTARDKCKDMDIPEFMIRLYNVERARGYELPTSNTLGAMVFDSGITSNT